MTEADPEGGPGAQADETPSGFLGWLGRAPWGELAGVAAVLLGAVVLFFVFVAEPPVSPRLTAGIAPGMAQRLMALPPTPTRAASIHFEDTHPGQRVVREEGAAIRMSFQIEQPGRVLVIEERHGLHLVQLFPPAGRPSVPVTPGRRVEVTDPSGSELVVGFPRGLRRVRLFLFPEDVDPLTLQPTELTRLGSQLLVIERNYRAGRRGERRM